MQFLKMLYRWAFKLKATRFETEDARCPHCGIGTPILYSINEDCCTTCNSKWEISDQAAKDKVVWMTVEDIESEQERLHLV